MKKLLYTQDAFMFYFNLCDILPDIRLDCRETERPESMDTLGSLIDKLTTVNLKMWHNQEQLYAIRRMSAEEFIAIYEDKLDELHGVVRRCCDLNVQRSTLMDAIDQLISDIVSGQKPAQVRPQHKTY